MSGASVCVLAPNGRRNTIKCTPNTTILQILEEACRKQSLNSEEFDIKHHNKILDTSTTFRFSGLPNNAQLELVQATKLRADTEVILAVNLEDGNRLVGNFNPSDTLSNILNKLCPDSISKDKNPVIIYTRREIYGNELETVTLKSLGLTGGRAMIRLIHRSPEELKIQANVAAPLPSKPVEEKPYIRKLIPVEPEKYQYPQEQTANEQDVPKIDEDKKETKTKQKGGTVDVIKLAKEKRKSNDSAVSGNKEKRPSLVGRSGNQPDVPKPTEPPVNCECKQVESMEVECCGKCEDNCTNLTDTNIEDEFIFLGDRNAMLFSLETAKAIPSEDLPDDFFDLTIDDAKKLLRDVRKQMYVMDNTPLKTANLRNLEESKKQLRQINKYKKTIIRVQFPDRTVLQGTFAPSDTVKHVIDFVREYLEDKSLKFYVYSTPPKEVLEENQSLLELGFIPGALVHFGTTNSQGMSYLRKDLQDKFTSNSVASLAASRMRSANIRKCTHDLVEDMDFEMNQSQSVNAGASTSSGITHENYGERKIVKTTEKLPKWFKP